MSRRNYQKNKTFVLQLNGIVKFRGKLTFEVVYPYKLKETIGQ